MRRAGVVACAVALLASFGAPARADVPRIDAPVTDRAGVLSSYARTHIDQRLRAHRDATGVQMAVLIVDSTNGVAIEDYSIAVAEAWGGGSKARSDGVLFVLAIRDRRMRLELGHDLESVITDGAAARLLDGVKFSLKESRYDDAVQSVVTGVLEATAELRPGQGVPMSYRLRAFFGGENYLLHLLMGVTLGFVPFWLAWSLRQRKPRLRGRRLVAAGLFVTGYVGIPALLIMRLPGHDRPAIILVLYGLVLGAVLWSTKMPGERKRWIARSVAGAVFATVCLVVYLQLHRVGPGDPGVDQARATLFILLTLLALLGFPVVLFTVAIVSGTYNATSYRSSGYGTAASSYASSSYSSSSSTSYGSSSSSSSSGGYSGGGGSFGGGGASASW